MKIIDVHAHFLTKDYVDALTRFDRLTEDGFPIPHWDLSTHLELMEDCGISHSVLSLSSPHPYFRDDKLTADIVRGINEFAADIVRRYPDKFSYAACLPLPNVEMAIAEARWAFENGAIAVKIASQSEGLYLGDAALDPLMEYLDSRSAVIIIHPSRPQAFPTGCFTSGPHPLLEFLNDTTRAVINMIVNGTFARFPHIRVVVPHCGSFLPNVIDRLAGLTAFLASRGQGSAADISGALRSMYFDLSGAVYPRSAAILSTLAGPDRIMYGCDYPFTPVPAVKASVAALMSYGPYKNNIEDICHTNAEKLFNFVA